MDLVQEIAFKIRAYYDRHGSGLEQTSKEIAELLKTEESALDHYNCQEYTGQAIPPTQFITPLEKYTAFVTAKKSLKYDRIQWLVDKPNQKTLDLILTFLNLSRVVVKWNSDSLFLLDRPVNWFIDVDVHNPSNGKCLFFWQD